MKTSIAFRVLRGSPNSYPLFAPRRGLRSKPQLAALQDDQNQKEKKRCAPNRRPRPQIR